MTTTAPQHKFTRLWKIGAWVLMGLAVLMLLAVVAVTVVLHSTRVHNYLLSTIQQKASEAIGTQVQLQNFALHPSNLSLDIYGLTVHGANPSPDPPLLQVAHAEAGSALSPCWIKNGISTVSSSTVQS